MDLWITIGFLLLLCVDFTVMVVEAGSTSGDINTLLEFRMGLSDPQNALQSWGSSSVDPCTWLCVTCDSNNRVTRLDVMRRGLSGNVSPRLGDLDSLISLELFGNNFSGPIPEELGNLVNLKFMDLYNNQFSGRIPPSLGKLNHLVFMRLNNNQLTGSIPGELGNIPSLSILDVSSNNLCGPVPSGGSLSKLQINYSNNPSINKPC